MVKRAVDEFHIHYEKSRIWEKTSWLGVPCWKLPFDAFILQEMIYEVRPEYIIETGTAYGGSALFFASICELLGEGKVITCDIQSKVDQKDIGQFHWADRIEFIHGGSLNQIVRANIKERCEGKRNLVILDSYHSYAHVKAEIAWYSKLVPVGSYLIVEDTHVSGHPVPWEHGKGPYEAVEDFLSEHEDWRAEYWAEKYIMTFNPMGYLKRIK